MQSPILLIEYVHLCFTCGILIDIIESNKTIISTKKVDKPTANENEEDANYYLSILLYHTEGMTAFNILLSQHNKIISEDSYI